MARPFGSKHRFVFCRARDFSGHSAQARVVARDGHAPGRTRPSVPLDVRRHSYVLLFWSSELMPEQEKKSCDLSMRSSDLPSFAWRMNRA